MTSENMPQPAPVSRSAHLRLILASMATYSLSSMQITLQPVIVEEFVSQRGMSGATTGLVATVELIVLALTMMLWARYVPSVKFRTMALLGTVLTVFAAIGSMLIDQFIPLLGVRILSAVGFGLLTLAPTMSVAPMPNAQSLYGRMYSISLIAGAVLLASLPWLSSLYGGPSAFRALLVYAAFHIPFILMMPGDAAPQGGGEAEAGSSAGLQQPVLFFALGFAALSFAFLLVWAFLLLLAGKAGLSATEASSAPAIGLVGAMIGSLLSAPMARAIGTGRLILLSTVTLGFSLLVILDVHHALAFRLSVWVALFSLYALMPALLGAVAGIDPSGKGAAVVNGAAMLFGAGGPYLGGMLLDLGGLTAMTAATMAVIVLTLILFGLALMKSREEAVARSVA